MAPYDSSPRMAGVELARFTIRSMGASQFDDCRATGLSAATVNDIMDGRGRLSMSNIGVLASYLNIRPDALLDTEGADPE